MATKRSHESGTPRLQAFQARQTWCAKSGHNSKSLPLYVLIWLYPKLLILQGYTRTFYSHYANCGTTNKTNKAILILNLQQSVCGAVFRTSSNICIFPAALSALYQGTWQWVIGPRSSNQASTPFVWSWAKRRSSHLQNSSLSSASPHLFGASTSIHRNQTSISLWTPQAYDLAKAGPFRHLKPIICSTFRTLIRWHYQQVAPPHPILSRQSDSFDLQLGPAISSFLQPEFLDGLCPAGLYRRFFHGWDVFGTLRPPGCTRNRTWRSREFESGQFSSATSFLQPDAIWWSLLILDALSLGKSGIAEGMIWSELALGLLGSRRLNVFALGRQNFGGTTATAQGILPGVPTLLLTRGAAVCVINCLSQTFTDLPLTRLTLEVYAIWSWACHNVLILLVDPGNFHRYPGGTKQFVWARTIPTNPWFKMKNAKCERKRVSERDYTNDKGLSGSMH